MVALNYDTKEISCKIVYYGPGLCGKTTNLQVIHRKIPEKSRSEMISLATESERTLFFDFLPLDLGRIKGYATKFQLYTVPGQIYYNETRKLVLRGVDGVVFVADSQADKMTENIESLANLEENLSDYGLYLASLPHILQWNKRDLPGVSPVQEMNLKLNRHGAPTFEAQALKGIGVFDTLKAVSKLVIDKYNGKLGSGPSPGAAYQRKTTTIPVTPGAPQPSSAFRPVSPRPASLPPTPPAQPALRPAPAAMPHPAPVSRPSVPPPVPPSPPRPAAAPLAPRPPAPPAQPVPRPAPASPFEMPTRKLETIGTPLPTAANSDEEVDPEVLKFISRKKIPGPALPAAQAAAKPVAQPAARPVPPPAVKSAEPDFPELKPYSGLDDPFLPETNN